MKLRYLLALALLAFLAFGCSDATGPTQVRPSFETVCSLPGHNSGQCVALLYQFGATSGFMGVICTKAAETRSPMDIGKCMTAIGAAAEAGQRWQDGRDAFGHQGPADCNWCWSDDPPPPTDNHDLWW